MVHLLADDTPLSILSSLVEPVVVYDPSGTRVIGHFTPIDLERGKRLYAKHASRVDAEEIATRSAAKEARRPFNEVVAAIQAAEAEGVGANGAIAEVDVSAEKGGCATR